METNTTYIFVIDTNSYSGNFERAMTAFCTGVTGECGVGDEMAEEVMNRFPDAQVMLEFEDKVTQRADDHGCWRPTTIWPTPGRVNDGYGGHSDAPNDEVTGMPKGYPAYESVAIFFEKMPSPEAIEFMKARAKEFRDVYLSTRRGEILMGKKGTPLEIKGFRMLKESTSVTTVAGEIPL